MKALRFLIMPLLAGALLLQTTHAAEAAEIAPTTTITASAVSAKATQIGDAVTKSLKATGKAEFTGADGVVHRWQVTDGKLVLDGKTAVGTAGPAGSTALAAGWVCTLKVAAAMSAILGLGAVFIGWFVAPLAAGTMVTLAGLTFSAGTWGTIAAVMGSTSVLSGFLHDVLC